ncbi:MAG: aminopeptidase [Patescibacteria group bacterium]
MQILSSYDKNHTIRALSEAEQALARQILTQNLAAHASDELLIITIPEMLEQEAALWFEVGKSLTKSTELIVISDMTHSGQEPPVEIIERARRATLSIFQTEHSLTHTQAGKAAIQNNGRGASLPGANYELIMRSLACDFNPILDLGNQLAEILRQGTNISITSTVGTNLTAKIRTIAVYNDSSLIPAGELGNLPGGEVFFAPLLDSTEGTLVIDGSIADDILDEPIVITIKHGRAVAIKGGTAAQNLQKSLAAAGPLGFSVAEIGIGTNPNAQISPNLLEAEKAYGTVHVAFGNSSAIGGEINVPVHIDGLVAEPEVRVDGKKILSEKKFNTEFRRWLTSALAEDTKILDELSAR